MTYDSTVDTMIHARRVDELLLMVTHTLLDRVTQHDRSKLEPPEKPVYDEYVPKLQASEFGSDEYNELRDRMGEGLAHHYAHNRHHPEFFSDGVAGMTLVDLVELLADWKAATERRGGNGFRHSLEVCQARFGITDQLTAILRNKAIELGWLNPQG
jgi:hypothetical protein